MFFVSSGATAAKTEWKPLDQGLEYAVIRLNPGAIHAFRVDPKHHRFGIVTAKAMGRSGATVKAMAKRSKAIMAINGGFFTPELESLGLLISDGRKINPLKNTSWWSVFYIRGTTPYITHTNSFREDPSISMAVQSGPRLLVGGSVPKLKPSFAERSAICVTGKRKVVLIATEDLVIQPGDLADYLKKGEMEEGFGCRTALNLDGGSSTQIYARIGSFELDVPGAKKVANAVVVYPK